MTHSLFVKIFFWFWLTIGVLIVGSYLVLEATESLPLAQRWVDVRNNAIGVYGQNAAEIYEKKGDVELHEYFRRWEKGFRVRGALFNSKGEFVVGMPLPAKAALLARSAVTTERVVTDSSAEETLAAKLVQTAQGNSYVIVSEMPGGPVLFSRVSWRVRAIRGIAFFSMAGLLCYLLARYLTVPVVRLRAATQRFAAGDLTARVGVSQGRRRDELIDLGRDFDAMAERIESLMNAQKRLISDVSHELRSPLTRLNVSLELAKQRAGADAMPMLSRIEREAERLSELIGQLLTLSKLENTNATAGSERVDLSQLVSDVCADADFEAQAKNRSVKVLRTEKCLVQGSTELLRRAIENVVRNAIRYTKEATTVEVTLTRNTRTATIVVRDHGEGVPEETLDELFRPFYRVADARDRQTGGIGLGLAITERAIRLHNGSVTAENASAGGLVVKLQLPLTN